MCGFRKKNGIHVSRKKTREAENDLSIHSDLKSKIAFCPLFYLLAHRICPVVMHFVNSSPPTFSIACALTHSPTVDHASARANGGRRWNNPDIANGHPSRRWSTQYASKPYEINADQSFIQYFAMYLIVQKKIYTAEIGIYLHRLTNMRIAIYRLELLSVTWFSPARGWGSDRRSPYRPSKNVRPTKSRSRGRRRRSTFASVAAVRDCAPIEGRDDGVQGKRRDVP